MKNFNLDRFHEAQDKDYATALSEIRNGRKQSHWIWYIFPQIQGLGFSPTSKYYALSSLKEAKAYVEDSALKVRLHEITAALLDLDTDDASRVMGYPDDMKLLSCMTLFELAEPDFDLYRRVIERFYGGKRDEKTLEMVSKLEK